MITISVRAFKRLTFCLAHYGILNLVIFVEGQAARATIITPHAIGGNIY